MKRLALVPSGYLIVLRVAAYAAGIVCAVVVTATGAYRVGSAVLAETARPPDRRIAVEVARPARAGHPQSVRRDASMAPTADNFSAMMPARRRPDGVRIAGAPQFGSSSRYSPRSRAYSDWDEDDDERPALGGTYRTVCVRLCDGYYFPVSFAVGREGFERDAQTCESRCGGQGRLFVYPNPGGAVEDMQDLSGRAYRHLRTAFLYRTEYVPSCKCQPDPWEAQSQQRHRAYALAAAARKGDKEALKALETLQQQMRRESAEAAARTASPPAPSSEAAVAVARPPAVDDPRAMRLGVGDPVKAPAPRPRFDADAAWKRRVFQQ